MPNTMLLTIRAVLDALDGIHGVATLTERSPQNVCNWRADGVIPAQHYPVIRDELAKRHLDVKLSLFSFKKRKNVRAA